jgi:hypothetical protein
MLLMAAVALLAWRLMKRSGWADDLFEFTAPIASDLPPQAVTDSPGAPLRIDVVTEDRRGSPNVIAQRMSHQLAN